MELVVFEQDKAYVRKALEDGTIDYLEAASEGVGDGVFPVSQQPWGAGAAGPELSLEEEKDRSPGVAVYRQ